MGIVNGVITTTQIGISDVSSALGASSSDIGTLCTHANINMWSKYKPFKSSQIGFADFTAFANAMKLAHWGLSFEKHPSSSGTANDGQYGSNFDALYNDAKNGYLPKIKYTKPTGGASSPYRLGDFMKYCHAAPVPIRPSIYNGDKVMQGTTDTEFYYEPQVEITPENRNTPDYYIKVSELYSADNQTQSFAEWYLGIFFFNPSSKDYYLATMDNKFGTIASGYEDAMGCRLYVNNTSFTMAGSVWKVLPFFATQKMNGTLHNSAMQSNGMNWTGSLYPLGFAMYDQRIRAFNTNTDTPMFVRSITAIIYTNNSTYNKYLYFHYELVNNTSNNSQNKKVELRITQKNSGSINQNVKVFERTIVVNAKSTYNSTVDSKYPNGNQMIEVDLSKVTGIDLGALLDAVRQGQVSATLFWESANESKTSNVINADQGNPTQP